jgi:hypothetical protein
MFSIREAMGVGWRIFRENMAFLVGVHVIAVLIQTLPQMFIGESPSLQAPVAMISVLVTFVTALGLVQIGLNMVDGVPCTYGDLFSQAHLVFKYLIASILHALAAGLPAIVMVGAVLLYTRLADLPVPQNPGTFVIIGALVIAIVLGAIPFVQFSLWPFPLVEKGMGPIEALRESSRLTRGVRARLILLYLAMAGIMILGLLAFVVGVIVPYAMITVASAFVYRRILAHELDGDGVTV